MELGYGDMSSFEMCGRGEVFAQEKPAFPISDG